MRGRQKDKRCRSQKGRHEVVMQADSQAAGRHACMQKGNAQMGACRQTHRYHMHIEKGYSHSVALS